MGAADEEGSLSRSGRKTVGGISRLECLIDVRTLAPIFVGKKELCCSTPHLFVDFIRY